MGVILRDNGLITRISRGSLCASACNHLFVGGPIRYIDPGGAFCLHMFSISGNPAVRNQAAASLGETIRNIEQISAQVGDLQRKYFKQMGISPKLNDLILQVSLKDVGCLSSDLLVELNIVNSR